MTNETTPSGTFTCPRCGAISHHPVDVAEGYCGRCHAYTGSGVIAPDPDETTQLVAYTVIVVLNTVAILAFATTMRSWPVFASAGIVAAILIIIFYSGAYFSSRQG